MCVNFYRKKSVKDSKYDVTFFHFGLKMTSRSVIHHSTAGSEALLLYSLFLMLPQYNDDDGGALNSFFHCSRYLNSAHSFVCLLDQSLFYSIVLPLYVCALANRTNSTICTLSSTSESSNK